MRSINICYVFCLLQTKEAKIGREQAYLEKAEFQKRLVIKEEEEQLIIISEWK